MKINWGVRFRNPAWLTAFLALVVSTAYQVMTMFDILPAITEETVVKIVAGVVQLLTMMGVLIDPTTKGIGDRERALDYIDPN